MRMPRHSAGLLTTSKKTDGVTWTKLRHTVGRHAAVAGRPQGRIRAEKLDPLERALAIEEKVLSPDHPDSASTLNTLALLYQSQGRYADAEPLFQRALTINEKAVGPMHPRLAQALENYALLLRNTQRGVEAEKLEARAKAIRAKHGQESVVQ